MRRASRFVRRALAGLGVLVLAGVLVVAVLLWMALPPAGGEARVPGLAARAEVVFDAHGIARIRAAGASDAAAALGWVHARDRLFQMEMMRRAASGRLSEIAGPATLCLDRTMRTLGLRLRAERDLDGLPPEVRALLDRYADGVNAYIEQRGRFAAPEFLLLGRPEPWHPVDSLLWGKVMGLWLSGNWRTELARAELLRRLPPERVRELWPPQDATPAPDAAWRPAATRLAAWLPAFPEPFTHPASASNGWAVDGRGTATGAPLLAGDPHLGYGLPGIWYLARIETPQGVLVGATAPGVPSLVLGHNGRIAWTFTTTGADTQDVFVETVLPDGRYATPDGPRAFEVREERIRVRGRPDEVIRVRETRHGPVISDLDASVGGPETAHIDAPGGGNGGPPGPVLAVAMANLAPGDAAPGLLALNRAQTVDDAGRAAAEIVAPVQNLIVADGARIAQYTTGRVPIRGTGDGATPVPGADGAHDWTGLASGDALPRYVAPASGRVVNGNERVAPPDYPTYLGRDWFGDWRARRIRALLDDPARHSLDGFAAMQVDAVSEFARHVLPALRATSASDGLPRRALDLLAGWDGSIGTNLPQPLILNAWMARFEALLLERAGVPAYAAGPRSDFVAWALTPAGAHLCGGACGPLLARSLAESTGELAARFGPDPAAWRWGGVHQAVFAHPVLGPVLGGVPVLGRFVAARIEQPGDDSTIYRGAMRGDFTSVHGAGFRGVYDLADLERSRFIVAPGQSGNPLRGLATDLVQPWRDGTTLPVGPRPETVSATMGLVP